MQHYGRLSIHARRTIVQYGHKEVIEQQCINHYSFINTVCLYLCKASLQLGSSFGLLMPRFLGSLCFLCFLLSLHTTETAFAFIVLLRYMIYTRQRTTLRLYLGTVTTVV
jgi:hypothetical protein